MSREGRIAPARRGGRRPPPARRPAPALALAPQARNAGRRKRSGELLAVLVTLTVAVGSYTVSARVSAERQQVEALARANARLAREVRTLGQELRVRMRLPQLQSWNDAALRLQPASAEQLLGGVAQLAVYALDAPPPPGPVLVSGEAEALPRLAILPPPAAPAARQDAPVTPQAPPAVASPTPAVPGLVLAAVAAEPAPGAEAGPEEGSGDGPGGEPAAPARSGGN